MTDWTPKTNVAEWHITYRCNLRCVGCNRFVSAPHHAPDMTLGDAVRFMEQAGRLNWYPEIRIIGGEPTLHHDLLEFIDMAYVFTGEVPVVRGGYGRVRVYSNGYGSTAILDRVRRERKAFVPDWALKPKGSVVFEHTDYCIAPCDIGMTRKPCLAHSACDGGCGISVDSQGYAICQSGAAIDQILKLDARTTTLADLFDPRFAAWQTSRLCSHCGGMWGKCYENQFPLVNGVPMSPAWQKAFEG